MERNEKGQFKQKYHYNKDFFKIIDTEEKAYALGFFYADGYNSYKESENSTECVISVCQLEQDIDILEKLRTAINSDYIFTESIQSTNGKKKYKFAIYNKELAIDLHKLGAVNNKSLILKFPSNDIVPENLMRHFIRGYFDGDGCIWSGKPKIMEFKSGKRFIHNMKFTFTGCISFIDPLQDYLIKVGVVSRKTKLNFSKAKDPNNNTCNKVCTMEYSGRKQIEKLFNYLYNDSTIYGNRKYNKFLDIICADSKKLLSETWLNAEKSLES